MIRDIWTYEVKKGLEKDFISDVTGQSKKLFSDSEYYFGLNIGVQLKGRDGGNAEDSVEGRVYKTIDTWASINEMNVFLSSREKEYKKCTRAWRSIAPQQHITGFLSFSSFLFFVRLALCASGDGTAETPAQQLQLLPLQQK